MLIEQRLERCLAAADRVIAIADGEIVCDRDPSGFLEMGGRARARPADPRCPRVLPPPACARSRAASSRPARSSGARAARAPARNGASRRQGTGRRPPGRGRAPAQARAAARRHAGPVAAARGVARAARRAGDPARRRPAPGRRRGGRPDGAQRGGQVDAAASRRGPDGADPRTGRAARASWRCCSRTRATCSSTSTSARRLPPRRCASSASTGSASATPATCPPVSASGWHWRWCWAASGPRPRSPSTSPPAGWTGAKRRLAQWLSARARAGHWCWSRPTTASSRSNSRPARCCWPAAAWSPTGRSTRCSPAGATSRPNRPASSAATRTRSASRRRPRSCVRAGPRSPDRGGSGRRARGGGDVTWQLLVVRDRAGHDRLRLLVVRALATPARMVALVAALAALAALGRDAFAAVPDGKPITAIVLVTGVAFGPAPGFATGALAALASNVLLGEGPWTPWQMLGWGRSVCWERPSVRSPPPSLAAGDRAGVRGRGRGLQPAARPVHVDRDGIPHARRLSAWCSARRPCSTSPTWSRASSSAWLSARSCCGCCCGSARACRSAGAPPAVGRAAGRVVLVPALGGTGGRALAAATAPSAEPRAAAYLERAQNADGGFGAAPGQSSGELYTAWAAIGLAADGSACHVVARDGHSPLDSLRGEAATLQGPGDLERTILALHACGASTHSLPGGDPTTRLLASQNANGSFEQLSNLTEFGILALRAAGLPASSHQVRSAARWLAAQQQPGGGFGFAARTPGVGNSDVDDTGAAIRRWSRPAGPRRRRDARGPLPPQRPEPRRRPAPAARRQLQRPVDRLGDPGPRRGRDRRRPRAPRRERLAARVPRRPDGRVGERALLANQHPDPGVGHGEALAALAGKPLPVAPPPRAPVVRRRRRAAASTGAARRGGPRPAVRRPPATAAASDLEAARASATARALGALAALMLSPWSEPVRRRLRRALARSLGFRS